MKQMTAYDYFTANQLKITPKLVNDYVSSFGGTVINTFRDSIFTDDRNVSMDTEQTIVLKNPLILETLEFADRVEINPNFIVSISSYKPKSKIKIAH